jgi:hypothetical protein
MKRLATAWIFLMLFAGVALAQENAYLKNFQLFKDVAPGVDFYASSTSVIEPYVKPVVAARKKLVDYLGTELARGAIFICSNTKQKDAVYDTRTFKLGYKWYLVQLTAEAQREEQQARMKALMAAAAANGASTDAAGAMGGRAGGQRSGGGQPVSQGQRSGQGQPGAQGAPGGQRGGGMPGGMDARAATTLATQAGYASLIATFDPNTLYRLSRVEDVGRSPLIDWLDIALVADASGTGTANLRFLQDRLEEAFPLDDVLIMNRPFVATQDSGSGGGGGGTRGGGSSGQAGGRGGSSTRVLAKDVQDRLLFDAQAASFLYYLTEKAGIDKVKDIVRKSIKGEESFTLIQGILGKDFDEVDKDWQAWIKTQKPAEGMRAGGPGI